MEGQYAWDGMKTLRAEGGLAILQYFLNEHPNLRSVRKSSMIAPKAIPETIAKEMHMELKSAQNTLRKLTEAGLLEEKAEYSNVVDYGITEKGKEFYSAFRIIGGGKALPIILPNI